jgi:hypothetical protein
MLSRLSSFSGPLSKLFNAIKGFTLNGLILRYEISDRDSYSGSNTVTDLVSNSNATLTNGPTYSINGYINFDGANDYLLTNTSLNSKLSPANTSSVISHFIWIYPTDNGVIVSEQGNPPLNSGWHDSQIEIVAGNLKFGLWQTGGGVSSLNSSISTPFYNWYYVGLTYDGSIMRGYVNGQLAGSKSVSRWTPYNNGSGVGLNYAIAANDNTSLGDGSPAKMKLGAFHVYNKALSNQEIVSNYNYTKSNYIYTGSMSIWIDANDPASFSGGSLTDLSGNGYTHTLTSGATSSILYGFKSFDCTTGSKRIVVDGTGPTLPITGYTYVIWARAINDSSSFRTLLYTKSPRYTPITIPSGTNTLGYWDTAFRSSGYGLTSSIDSWIQYSVVGDNSSQTFYINDYQVGSSISYGSGGTLHDGLGNNLGTSQSFGHVGNMMLYNKKLTLDEIKQNYDAFKNVYKNGNFVTSNLNLCLLPSNAGSSNWSTSTGTVSTTMTGSPTYNSLGYTFNGTSQYGRMTSINGVTNFTNTQNYTVEVWFNPTSGQPNAGGTTILEKWNLGDISRYPYTFRYAENINSVYVAAFDGNITTGFPLVTLTGITVNNWYQVVGVFNFTTDVLTVYKNGVSTATVSLVGVNDVSNPSPVGIAHRISVDGLSAEFMFKGSIGIIRMYSSALSASDVSKNFEANRGLYGI